jgi:CRP-like cAMP-binding protein
MPTHHDGRAHLAPSLREVFDRVSVADTRLRFDAQAAIYASGDDDESMYLIESGQVKLSMSSASGKDCLIAIYSTGDVFGESCFNVMRPNPRPRCSTRSCAPRREPRRRRTNESDRVAARASRETHRGKADRVSISPMPSERRLAKVLLGVAEKLGAEDGVFLELDQKISHEELSQIVGTTRPRITAFIQGFRERGLLVTVGRKISLHRERMRDFADQDEVK